VRGIVVDTGMESRTQGQSANDGRGGVVASLCHFVPKWTPALRRNASPYLLRLLVCKLYGASKGNLFHAKIRAYSMADTCPACSGRGGASSACSAS
jgi:hypothetical protein